MAATPLDAQYDESVKAYVVGDAPSLAVYRPPDELSETQKAAVQSYIAGQTGSLTQVPNAFVSDYETVQAFALAGALAPPEDPRQVANVYRRSSALRPCVESVATNAVGFGYSFEPVIDLDKQDADKRIREAILQDYVAQGIDDEPTNAAVAETRKLIERESLRERFKLERFFSHICPSRSFNKLRYETRIEIGSGGNAFWEVCRREDRSVALVDRLEAHTVRLRRTEERYLNVEVNQRRSPLSYERVTVPMRFRTFVQIVLGGARAVYFKQYGDPRILSSETGRFYPTMELFRQSEPRAPAATEIVHWRAFDTIGPYGLPPWYGAQYAVLGVLASERVNYDYFDNRAVPPWAVLVSGGRLRDGALDVIKQHMKELKGQGQFWKTLVLEAEGAAGNAANARCKIEIVPLFKDQPQDALFQQYEANNAKKVQQQWRLPDLLVGRSQEANRAQAEAALQMAEQQIFQPVREEEDDFFNRFILPEMGIRFWRFKTNSAVAKDPQLQTEIGTAWVKAGVLTPNEGRAIAGEVLNKDYAAVNDPWGNIPQPLILAGIMPGVRDGVEQPVTGAEESLARQVIAIRDTLRGQAESGAAVAEVKARMREAVTVKRLGAAEWNSLWAAD